MDVLLFLGHLAFIFIFFSSEKRLQFLQFSVPNQTCHSRGIAAASNAALERYAPPSSHNKSQATTTTSCHSQVNGIKEFLHPCFLSWNHFTDKTQTSRSASAREGILDYLYSFFFFPPLSPLLRFGLQHPFCLYSTNQHPTEELRLKAIGKQCHKTRLILVLWFIRNFTCLIKAIGRTPVFPSLFLSLQKN